MLALPARDISAEAAPDALLFWGRFHPLLLHLPIGFLVLAMMMEVFGRIGAFAPLRQASGFALGWGGLLALVTAALGWMLSLEGGYEATALAWHQWTGIATAVLAVLAYLLRLRARRHATPGRWLAYDFVSLLLLGTLTVAGHLGASLTHGATYLFEYAPDNLRNLLGLLPRATATAGIGDFETTPVYQGVIEPIFAAHCQSCHGAGKRKGGLNLAAADLLLAGGDSGPALVAGRADSSELMRRLHLPADDEKHMPPPGKRPLSREQIALLTWWIDRGAPTDTATMVASLDLPEPVRLILEDLRNAAPALSLPDVPRADTAALARARAQGWVLLDLAAGSPWLRVRPARPAVLTPAAFGALQPLAAQVFELNLSQAALHDSMLASVGAMPHLVRLYLDRTPLADSSLRHLRGLAYLQYLNLYGTPVSDAALDDLAALASLRQLYLWQTKVSPAGLDSLRQRLPQARIDTGMLPGGGMTLPLTAPQIEAPSAIFADSLQVRIRGASGVQIRYTLDGSEPGPQSALYTGPVVLREGAAVRAAFFAEGAARSESVQRSFFKAGLVPAALTLTPAPDARYAAQEVLYDRRTGSTDHRDGTWLGVEGGDFSATIDLGAVQALSRVRVSCLENPEAWIFFPRSLEVWTSVDGSDFRPRGRKVYAPATGDHLPELRYPDMDLGGMEARYVKLRLESSGPVPTWHPAAGGASWIFVDEVLLE
ncbi:MAG: hypothetical protein OHK0039_40450 [Bacteroidia bacterium]